MSSKQQQPTEVAITLDQQNPKYGDIFTFTTSVPKLAGWEYPMIALVAFQDVDQDGDVEMDIQNKDIVFSLLQQPGTQFPTAPPPEGAPPGTPGSYSIWSERGGGPAEARADLCAYGWKGGKESVRVLATTGPFHIDG